MNESEYRDLLVERGLAFEVPRGFIQDIQKAVAGADAPVVTAMRHGWFTSAEFDSDLLMLPPDRGLLMSISKALLGARTSGDLTPVVENLAAETAETADSGRQRSRPRSVRPTPRELEAPPGGRRGFVAPVSGLAAAERLERKIGKHRGKKRVWLEGKWLATHRFKTGTRITVVADKAAKRVTIQVDPDGKWTVSRHRGTPVIDLLNVSVSEVLAESDEMVIETHVGELVISPKDVDVQVEERQRNRNGLEAAVFSGAGFLSLAAERVGYRPAFAIDCDPVASNVYAANFKGASVWTADAMDVVLRHNRELVQGRRLIPQVELVTGGIPCEPWSKARGGADPASHELVAATFYFLMFVMAANPLNVVIEEVPLYLKSEAFGMLWVALKKLRYHVQWATLDSNDLGELAGRKRAVIVATTDPAPGLFEKLERPAPPRAGDRLLPVREAAKLDPAYGGWFTTRESPGDYLARLWEREKWKPAFIDPSSTRVTTITSSYFKPAPSGPFVKHPTKPDTYRLLSVEEIRDLHGVPEDFQLTGHPPTDVSLLGRGVVVPVFEKVIKALPGASVSSRRRNTPPQPDDDVTFGELMGARTA